VTRHPFPIDPTTWTEDGVDVDIHDNMAYTSHGKRVGANTEHRTPSFLEALMACPPGTEPSEWLEETQELREAVVDCIDQLDDLERFVIEAYVYERISFRDLGDRLGVSDSQAHRFYHQTLKVLKRYMQRHPYLQERLGLSYSTWDDAARGVLLDIAPDGADTAEDWHVGIQAWMEGAKAHSEPWRYDEGSIVECLTNLAYNSALRLEEIGEWSVDAITELLASKQHDYGPGNILAFGLYGIVVRMNDKVARLDNLMAKGARARNESVLDTLIDLVGYAVVAQMLVDGTFELPLAGAK
jgi:hypothetical protein